MSVRSFVDPPPLPRPLTPARCALDRSFGSGTPRVVSGALSGSHSSGGGGGGGGGSAGGGGAAPAVLRRLKSSGGYDEFLSSGAGSGGAAPSPEQDVLSTVRTPHAQLHVLRSAPLISVCLCVVLLAGGDGVSDDAVARHSAAATSHFGTLT